MSRLKCGCTPDDSGFGYCGECVRNLREKIWREMSERERNFDRYVAPDQSAKYDETCGLEPEYNTSCSRHINPPCSYCMSKNDDDYDE